MDVKASDLFSSSLEGIYHFQIKYQLGQITSDNSRATAISVMKGRSHHSSTRGMTGEALVRSNCLTPDVWSVSFSPMIDGNFEFQFSIFPFQFQISSPPYVRSRRISHPFASRLIYPWNAERNRFGTGRMSLERSYDATLLSLRFITDEWNTRFIQSDACSDDEFPERSKINLAVNLGWQI